MKIVVLGAGIGGLTAALALSRRGRAVEVIESAPEIRAVGAGIWVPPNAMRVLDELGVGEAVRGAGIPLERITVMDHRERELMVVRGEELVARFGSRTISIRRASLHEILAAALPAGALKLGKECVGVSAKGERVVVELRDGAQHECDLLVAADGLRSVTRGAIFPRRDLRYSGQTCFRGISTMTLPAPIARASAEVWGAGVRLGASPVGPRDVYWYTTVPLRAGSALANDEAMALLRERFAAFPRWVREIFEAVEPSHVIQTDLSDLEPGDDWVRGRVALLGDAAHATTPNLGQGAAMAIEDGFVLARELEGAPIDEALRAYVEKRRARVRFIVTTSWRLGKVSEWTNPIACAARDFLMRSIPSGARARQLEDIYAGPANRS